MRRTSLHAHAAHGRPGRRTPPPAGDLTETITATGAAVVAIGRAVAGLEAGLASQVNVLDALLAEAATRQAPWQRPIATRVSRGRGM